MKKFSITQASLALAACGALLLTACTPPPAEDTERRLVVGLSSEPGAIAPGQAPSTVNFTLDGLVHRGLMAYNNQGELIPGLAESVKTEDNKVFDVQLRDNLKFANGEPLTAEQVKKSYEYLSNPESKGAGNTGLLGLDSIDIVSDSELTFTLKEPNNAFQQYLAIPSAAVYPATSLEAEKDSLDGAGPYKVKEYVQGQHILLTKNENFYGAADVALDEIDLVFYSDGTARSNALMSGDVDLIDYVPWEEFDTLKARNDIVVDTANGPYMYAMFNVKDRPFSNPLLRQAIGYAINRKNTVDAAFAGNGKPLLGMPLAESDPAYDPKWEQLFQEDMNRARDLIKESGFDTSQPITLLTNSQYKFHEDVGLSMLADLKELGLNVDFQSPDWATLNQRAVKGEYDLLINGDVGQVADAAFLSFFVQGNESAAKSYGYQNEELARLIQAGSSAATDEEKKKTFDQVREVWSKDVPLIMLNQRAQAHAYKSSVKGFKTLPGFLSFYSGDSFMYTKVE